MAIIGVSGYAGSGKDTVGKLIQIANCVPGSITTPIEKLLADYNNQQWWLEEQSGWQIKKWAGKLKVVASMLTGIPIEKFEDQQFKHQALGREWCYPTEWQGREHWVEMTVREFLQKLGTDACRNGLHPNTWVNALMADYKSIWNDPDPIPGNDYSITYRENYGKTSFIRYGRQSEAEVFNHEITEPNWIITDTRFPNEAQAIKKAGGFIIRVERPGTSAINAHPSETALDDWEFDYRIANASDLISLFFTICVILKKEKILV